MTRRKDAASAGFSLWWDRHIPPGKTWDSFIGRSLDAANCVLVLRSRFSVASRWARKEAEHGALRRCLIPVLAEPVELPLGFARIEAADLCAWHGDENARFAPATLRVAASYSGSIIPSAVTRLRLRRLNEAASMETSSLPLTCNSGESSTLPRLMRSAAAESCRMGRITA